VGEVSVMVEIYTLKKHFNCWGFLRNPGVYEHLWATSLIVLRAFLWYSCICQNTICFTNSTVSHREKTHPSVKSAASFKKCIFLLCCIIGTKSQKMSTETEVVVLFPLVLIECYLFEINGSLNMGWRDFRC